MTLILLLWKNYLNCKNPKKVLYRDYEKLEIIEKLYDKLLWKNYLNCKNPKKVLQKNC